MSRFAGIRRYGAKIRTAVRRARGGTVDAPRLPSVRPNKEPPVGVNEMETYYFLRTLALESNSSLREGTVEILSRAPQIILLRKQTYSPGNFHTILSHSILSLGKVDVTVMNAAFK